MNQNKQSRLRPPMHFYVVSMIFLMLAFSAVPKTVQGQWTTSGENTTTTSNVGIGTTAPEAKLDVKGKAIFSGDTIVAGRGTFSIDASNNLNLSMFNQFKINAAGLVVNGSFESFDNYFGMRQTSNNTLTVRIPASGNAYFNQGNVGIGTGMPTSKLTVADGNIHVQSTALVSGGSMGDIGFGPGGGVYWGVTPRAFMRGYFQGPNWYSGTALAFFTHAGGDITANGNALERLRIDKDGQVGIGTTSPAYKLDVSGEINATGLRINGTPVGSSPWATGSGNVYYNMGNVGIGTTAPATRLHVAGDITVEGNINAKYQDVAEWVPSRQKLEAGTVVALDPEKSNHVLASSEAYDTRVAGVISAQPGISLGERGEGKVLVATTGRVRVKVDATRAPIRIGDLLVTSKISGVAMRSQPMTIGKRQIHAPGTLIGKALEPLKKGRGEILVLLSLQ